MADYSSRQYWEQRYLARSSPFDWYLPWSRVDVDVTTAIPSPDELEGVVLVPGCGTSPLPEELYDALRRQPAFARRPSPVVIGIDWAAAAVDAQIKRASASHVNRPGLSYITADAGNLSGIDAGTVSAVVEKALVDATLCGFDPAASSAAAGRIVREMYRVLAEGGAFVHITVTAATEGSRRAIFEQSATPWREATMVPLGEGAERPHFMFIFRK